MCIRDRTSIIHHLFLEFSLNVSTLGFKLSLLIWVLTWTLDRYIIKALLMLVCLPFSDVVSFLKRLTLQWVLWKTYKPYNFSKQITPIGAAKWIIAFSSKRSSKSSQVIASVGTILGPYCRTKDLDSGAIGWECDAMHHITVHHHWRPLLFNIGSQTFNHTNTHSHNILV